MSATAAREEILGDIRRALKREVKPAGLLVEPVPSVASQLEQLVCKIKKDCERHRGDLINQFEFELTRVGGHFHRATTPGSAGIYIKQIASERRAETIVYCDALHLHGIDLPKRLKEAGIELVTQTSGGFIATAAVADIGVSGIDYALADTGTLVLLAREGQARSISLLPPVHIAVMKPAQVISGLNDLFPLLRREIEAGGETLSSAITFITGPSRTADIELTLVVGVHGPQQLHVILVEG